MRRSILWSSLLIVALVVTSLACSIGGKEEPTATPTYTPVPPTATPVPPTATPVPPTATPRPTNTPAPTPTDTPESVAAGEMIPIESQTLGVRLSYPEGWSTFDMGIMMLVSDQPLDMESMGATDEMPEGLFMVVLAGPAEEFEMQDLTLEDLSSGMLGELTGEFDEGEVEMVGTPKETTINGVPAVMLEIRATEAEQQIHAKATILNDGTQAAMILAVSPDDLWENYADSVDAILETVELFEGTGFDWSLPTEEGEWRGELTYGDLVADAFEGGEIHAWTFTGYEDEYATVIMTPLGEDMDVTIQLLDPDLGVLVDLDDAFSGEAEILLNFVLPVDGEYTIHVQEFWDAPGEYELELLGGETPSDIGVMLPPELVVQGDIEIGSQVEATLAEAEMHGWTFLAAEGDIVDIYLIPSEDMDVTLSVMSPDGTLKVEALDDGFSGEAEELFGMELDEAGEYLIMVDEYWDVSGDYTLEIYYGDEVAGDYEMVDMGEIAYDEVWEASLPEGMFLHVWSFSGTAGDVVTVIATPLTDGADLQLALVDPSDEFLFDLDDGGSDEQEAIYYYELLSTGTYQIIVAEYWEVYADYELSLTLE